MLPLMESFYTIQGEGYHTGKAAYFIRLGGCDIGCHWCDVKASWNPTIHPTVKIEDIIHKVLKHKADSVVVTGGEPLMYALDHLTKELKNIGMATFLETSGAYDLSGHWDWICLSPKRKAKVKPLFFEKANELKVIVQYPDDLGWAEENAVKFNPDGYLFLQAEWSKYDNIIPVIIDYVKQNPKWMVSLQSHKFMRIP